MARKKKSVKRKRSSKPTPKKQGVGGKPTNVRTFARKRNGKRRA